MTSPTVSAIAEIIRQSKSPRAVMGRIQERHPTATAADIAEAVGIVGGVQLDHASLREKPTVFAKPVSRRCERCREIFPARKSDETCCGACAGMAG